MASQFRIALGNGSFRSKSKSRDPLMSNICQNLLTRLNNLKSLSFNQMSAFPEVDSGEFYVDGVTVSFSRYRENLPDGGLLIVLQAFIPTFKWPTYISFSRVGHILSDGIIVTSEDKITEAPNNLLWEYR